MKPLTLFLFIANAGAVPSHPRRLRRARNTDQCAAPVFEFPEPPVRGTARGSATVTREAALEGLFRGGRCLGCRSHRPSEAHDAARIERGGRGVGGRLALSATLMLLMPLKHVEPSSCGSTTRRGSWMWCPCTQATPRYRKRSRRYLLTHYVTVCERFNFSTAESDYEECGAFTPPPVIRRGTRCGIPTIPLPR